MYALEHIIATIAPHRCLTCGVESALLCDICCALLPFPPSCCYKCGKEAQKGLCKTCRPFAAFRSITIRTIYEGNAKLLLHRLKFERAVAAAQPAAQSMAAYCPEGVVTHVPTASKRVRQRGYDQASRIAWYLARYTGNKYQPMLLRSGSQRQLGQDRQVRQQQLLGAFRLAAKLPPLNRPIILVDDVLTTGATVEAAAQILADAGYQAIHACLFAWAEPRLHLAK